ncbi:hypothetical protein B1R94_00420 [Mycolicibacterium litorale]|nr:hypothetical protein B1R94_00420 [Mycolicibacterium litorale]
MAEHVAAAGQALEASRSALAARDRELAEADADLAAVLAAAHDVATGAIRRLDAVSAEMEAAVAQRAVTTPHEGREFARFLLDKQHEIADIVNTARAASEAKAVALQHLQERYRI